MSYWAWHEHMPWHYPQITHSVCNLLAKTIGIEISTHPWSSKETLKGGGKARYSLDHKSPPTRCALSQALKPFIQEQEFVGMRHFGDYRRINKIERLLPLSHRHRHRSAESPNRLWNPFRCPISDTMTYLQTPSKESHRSVASKANDDQMAGVWVLSCSWGLSCPSFLRLGLTPCWVRDSSLRASAKTGS